MPRPLPPHLLEVGRLKGRGDRAPNTGANLPAYFEQVRGHRPGHEDWLPLVQD